MAMLDGMFGSESESLPGEPGASPAAAAPEAPPEAPSEAAAPEPSAPPAAPEPPPAAAAPAAPAAAPAEPRDGLVPIGALTEERARRRELQEQNQQMQSRLNELLLRMSQPQQQQPQVPAFEENPAEHLRAMQQQYEQQLMDLRNQVTGHNQRTQAVDQHTQFVNLVASREAEFASRTPDYHAATAFVQQRKMSEYKAIGLSETEARQALSRDTMSVAQIALQRGQNPAEVMYGLARTLGFAAPVQPAVQGQQRPAAPSSLQTAGGAPGADTAGQPTPEALAQMSDSEFDTWWNKFAGAQQGARLQ